jgi:hypothetical protein
MKLLAWCVVFAGLACAQRMSCRPTLFDAAQYPALASTARISGTVDARVVVGANGTVKSAAYTGHSLLVPAVQSAMDRSQLSGKCAGEYHLIYRFVLGSKLGEQSVQFNPPNEFVLIAPPMIVESSFETCSPRWFEVLH